MKKLLVLLTLIYSCQSEPTVKDLMNTVSAQTDTMTNIILPGLDKIIESKKDTVYINSGFKVDFDDSKGKIKHYKSGIAEIFSDKKGTKLVMDSLGFFSLHIPRKSNIKSVAVHGDESVLGTLEERVYERKWVGDSLVVDSTDFYWRLVNPNFTLRVYSDMYADTELWVPARAKMWNAATKITDGPTRNLPFVMDEGSSPQIRITGKGDGWIEYQITDTSTFIKWIFTLHF